MTKRMEDFVKIKSYNEFTKGVIAYMKRHSKDMDLLNGVKDRLQKAEQEIASLKQELIETRKGHRDDLLSQRTLKLEEEMTSLRSEKHKNAIEIKDIETKLLSIQNEHVNLSQQLRKAKTQPNYSPRLGDSIDSSVLKNCTFDCQKCHKTYVDRGKLRHHIQVEHPKTYSCTKCNVSFKEKHKLEEHIFVQHKESLEYQCDTCGKCFAMKWRFEKHNELHSTTNRKACHYFNNNKPCPYELVGCKFKHEDAGVCFNREQCVKSLCQYKH